MPPNFTIHTAIWLCYPLNAQVKCHWFLIIKSKWIVVLKVAEFGSSPKNYAISVMIYGWTTILAIAVTNLPVKRPMP